MRHWLTISGFLVLGFFGSSHLRAQEREYIELKKKVVESLAKTGGFCSAEKAILLMDLIHAEKPRVCVEIGACMGSSLLPIGAALKYVGEGKVYAIDPWSNQEAIRNIDPQDRHALWWSQVDMVEMRRQCYQMRSNWGLENQIQVYKQTSKKACKRIQTIDFIHFDGNFSEVSCLEDLALYLPKVKTGGLVLLSNYCMEVNGSDFKFRVLSLLLDSCDIILSLDGGNVLLLEKFY